MAIRTIVQIDEDKCDGCGLCVPGCAEGALQIVDGKARLVSEVYCDGLGACLGECPQGAIELVQREAEDFDEQAVHEHLNNKKALLTAKDFQPRKAEPREAPMEVQKEARKEEPLACGCPGTMSQSFERPKAPPAPPVAPTGGCPGARMQSFAKVEPPKASPPGPAGPLASRLGNWPVQITLVPPRAPYLDGSELVIAADCAPFAYADFHRRFLDGKVLLIGCPKLDDVQSYVDKLTAIFSANDIRSVDVVYMEVPCCNGLVQLVRAAIQRSGKAIPVVLHRVGIKGDFVEEKSLSGAA